MAQTPLVLTLKPRRTVSLLPVLSPASEQVVVVGVRADDGWHFASTDPMPFTEAEKAVRSLQSQLDDGRTVFCQTAKARRRKGVWRTADDLLRR